MNGRIVIFLRLLAIALTIAGIAADGETTPAAAAAANPVAASNPATPSKLYLERFIKIEQDNSGDSDGIKCYQYHCGEKSLSFTTGLITKVECKDPLEFSCADPPICARSEIKGEPDGREVDFVIGGCAVSGSPESGCQEDPSSQFSSATKACYCSTALCNRLSGSLGGSSSGNSGKGSSSSVSSTAFVTTAALVIAVKVNIF